MRWLALVLVIALAGCFGDDGGSSDDNDPDDGGDDDPGSDPGTGGGNETPDPTRTPMLVDFDYNTCAGARTLLFAPPDAVAEHLPEGYTADEQQATTGPVVKVEYFFVECQNLTTSASIVDMVVYGSVSIAIDMPDNATDSAEEAWYRVGMFVSEDVLESVWLTAQYNVYRGAFSQEIAQPPVPLVTTQLGDYQQQGIPQGSASRDVRAAYFTETGLGRLEWYGDVDMELSPVPAGTFAVHDTDPFADTVDSGTAGFEHAIILSAGFPGQDLWRI